MERWQAEFTPEDVLRQGPWLRTLARALVGEAGAEDVSQETWLRAARKTGLDRARLRPFLGGVLRRAASEWRREARRRMAREQRCAREAVSPSEGEVVERLELQELVVRALRELEEPYRRTLTLRFLEGLSGADIARCERLPEGTVRTRIARGLELLRQRLDERAGGRSWRLALFPLTLREPFAPSSIQSTGMVTAMLMKSGLGVVALALAAWLMWPRQPAGPTEATQQDPDTPTTAVNAAPTSVLGAGREEFATLSTPAGEAPSESLPVSRVEASVVARVVDFEGRPVEGVELSLAGEAGPRATSAPDGRVELLLPDVEAGPARLRLRDERFVSREFTVELVPSERTWAGELMLERGTPLRGRVLGPDGLGVPRALLIAARGARGGATEPGPAAEELASGPNTRSDQHGYFAFAPLEPGYWSLWASAPGRPWARLDELALASEPLEVEVRLTEREPARTIAGRVLTPERRPAAAARLRLQMEDGQILEARADEDGLFDFLTRAEHVRGRLSAMDADWRYEPREVELQAGVTDLELRFEDPLELTVHVRAADGVPLDGAGVHTCDEDGALVPGCDALTDAQGTARVRVPPAPFRLLVERAGFLPRVFGPYEPRSSLPALELAQGRAIHGRVLHAGAPLEGASVALHHMAPQGTWCAPRAWPFEAEAPVDALEPEPLQQRVADDRGAFLLAPPQPGTESGPWYFVARARGFATCAFGPFSLAELLAESHELALTRGGTLTGKLSRPAGGNAEGCLVWARNGLGAEAFTPVGPDGSYRLTHLTAGPWQVRALPPLSRGLFGLLDRSTTTPPSSDVIVDEGTLARFDLVLREAPEVRVSGRLSVEADPPGAWTVEVRARSERPERQESVFASLAPDGSFQTRVRGEHAVLLTFHATDPRWESLTLEVEVPVRDGRALCERQLSFARLTGEFAHLGGRTLYLARRGDERCYSAIRLDSSGAWSERLVPSGTLHCLDGEPGLASTTTLASLTLAAGASGRIER